MNNETVLGKRSNFGGWLAVIIGLTILITLIINWIINEIDFSIELFIVSLIFFALTCCGIALLLRPKVLVIIEASKLVLITQQKEIPLGEIKNSYSITHGWWHWFRIRFLCIIINQGTLNIVLKSGMLYEISCIKDSAALAKVINQRLYEH